MKHINWLGSIFISSVSTLNWATLLMSAGLFPFFSGNTSVFFFLYNYCFSPDLSCSFWSLAPALCNRAHCCDQDMIKTHAHTGFGIHWGAVSPAWRLHWDNYTGIHTGSVIRRCHRVRCVHNCVSVFLCVCFWYRFFVCENKKLARSLFCVCVSVSVLASARPFSLEMREPSAHLIGFDSHRAKISCMSH